MSNPFKGKVRVEEPMLPLTVDEDLINESIGAEIAHVEPIQPPKPAMWQRVLGSVLGNEVAALPAAPINSNTRISKRRLRRLRGRAKAA